MSEREQAKQIIDRLPESKIGRILLFLRGVEFDDEPEDDLFCEKLLADYLADPDPSKHEAVTLEELEAKLLDGKNTPLSECVPESEVKW